MRLLIDTDPGVDDGVALLMALRHPEAEVEALTVVHGNVTVDHAVRNARYIVETCKAQVPVYAGATAALCRTVEKRAAWIHGEDGFGDLGLRPAGDGADPGWAPDRIVDLLMAAPGEITLVALGPLTNIALAVAREPRIADAALGLVLLGGTLRAEGNVTPAAEFNIYTDPEAARAVFAAGFRLTMVGIELTRGPARLTAADVERVESGGSAPAQLAGTLLRHSLGIAARRPMLPGEHGAACPDAVAMAVVLDPVVLTDAADAYVDVETRGELTAGMTVIDRLGTRRRPANTRLGLAVDAERLKAMLYAL